MSLRSVFGLYTLFVLSAVAAPAVAQPAEAGAFAESNRDAASENDMRMTLTGGGTFAYGNAHTLGLNLAGTFFLRQADEQLDLEITYLLGMAEAPLTCNDDPLGVGCGGMMSGTRTGGFAGNWVENANNLTWRARYDHYLDPDDSIFVSHRGRRDPFAGLEVRLGLQLGYQRVLFREENHRLTIDLGVDGTVDLYTTAVANGNRAMTAFSPPPLQGTDGRFVPAVRIYLAYLNHLTESFTYDTGLEVLWNVVNPAHFRFDWQNHIRSRITDGLELSIDLILRVDSQPPGQAQPWQTNADLVDMATMTRRPGQVTGMFDFLTTLNLVGTIDLDGAPEAAPDCPEPAPCPECPACPACEACPTTDVEPPTEPTPEPAPEPAPSEPAPAPEAGAPNG